MLNVLELIIDEKDLKGGVNAVSVVEAPAIEENFVALAKHEVELKEIDAEKRILMGAALVPNKKIYRRNKEEEFYIYFAENTIRKAMELFFINGNQSSATFEHKNAIKGMTVVESWLIEDEKMDKSKLYGFNLPKGTWMISMKVDNDEVWQDVKEGKIKGFSIEGYFADKMPDSPRQDMSKNEIINQLKDLLK
jgi:phage head maturation protease